MLPGANELAGMMAHTANGHGDTASNIKFGYVTAYDPKNYAVRVRIEPESHANEQAGYKDPVVETNWLPIFRTFGGNGWGEINPPNANPEPPYGDHCVVLLPDGGQGVALVGIYNDVERAYTERDIGDPDNSPDPTPQAGERIFVHKTGAFLKLRNDGGIMIQARPNADSARIYLRANGRVEIKDATGNAILLEKNLFPKIYLIDADDDAIEMGEGEVNIIAGGGATSGVVTLQHLQNVVTQINATFATKQNGSGSPGAVIAEASTVVKASN